MSKQIRKRGKKKEKETKRDGFIGENQNPCSFTFISYDGSYPCLDGDWMQFAFLETVAKIRNKKWNEVYADIILYCCGTHLDQCHIIMFGFELQKNKTFRY